MEKNEAIIPMFSCLNTTFATSPSKEDAGLENLTDDLEFRLSVTSQVRTNLDKSERRQIMLLLRPPGQPQNSARQFKPI